MTDGIVHNELGRADEREVAVEDFKRKLVDASGELIPLAKPGPHGEKLFITSRFFTVPSEEVEVDAWYDTSSPDFLEEIDGMLLLDIFAQEEDKLLPIGHIDWQKKGEDAQDHANVRRNVHIKHTTEHEEEARRIWTLLRSPSIKVHPRFENMGLGTLLLSTSALVLHAKEARYFLPTSLVSGSIQSAVKKFTNIKDPGLDKYVRTKEWPIESYFKSPAFNQVFQDFAPKSVMEGKPPLGEK